MERKYLKSIAEDELRMKTVENISIRNSHVLRVHSFVLGFLVGIILIIEFFGR